MTKFLKTTIVGGLVFLLPIALILAVLGHAFRMAKKVAEPVSQGLHLDQMGAFAGIGIVTILAIVLLILISFLAGLAARTTGGARISAWFEKSVLGSSPQYQMMKSMAQGIAELESTSAELKPVLIGSDAGWEMGYLLEQLDSGWVVVFVPHAPATTSGQIRYVQADRIRALDMTMLEARNIIKNIGIGSKTALRGVDLHRSL